MSVDIFVDVGLETAFCDHVGLLAMEVIASDAHSPKLVGRFFLTLGNPCLGMTERLGMQGLDWIPE